MHRLAKGAFAVANPFNGIVSQVPARAEDVHTIVFWSKNYGPFLKADCGRQIEKAGYRLFFHFTINSPNPVLEPSLPSLEERLRQMDQLCRRHDPRRVNWRLDPICHFVDAAKTRKNNLDAFLRIRDAVHAAGVRRCTTSFMDFYPKIERRVRHRRDISFFDPAIEEKKALLLRLESALQKREMQLVVCCEDSLLNALPTDSTITAARCIDHEQLVALAGEPLSGRRDAGQRKQKGCGCHQARDIGSYRQQACAHGCLYCYASPMAPAPHRSTEKSTHQLGSFACNRL